MKYLKQAFVILTITLIAEILANVLPLSLPASIYGMLILFFGLLFGVIKLEDVEDAGEWLMIIMPMMFVVPSAGFITSWPSLQPNLIPWIVIILVPTVLVMGVGGLVAQFLQNRKDGNKEGGRDND